MQMISHYLHCYHAGPSHPHFIWDSILAFYSFAVFLSLVYLETVGDPQVTLFLKPLQWLSHWSQSKIKGSEWPTHLIWFGLLSPLWPLLYYSSSDQSAPGHCLLVRPGAWLVPPALQALLVLFVLPFMFFLQVFDSVSHLIQLFVQLPLPQWGSDHLLNKLPSVQPNQTIRFLLSTFSYIISPFYFFFSFTYITPTFSFYPGPYSF